LFSRTALAAQSSAADCSGEMVGDLSAGVDQHLKLPLPALFGLGQCGAHVEPVVLQALRGSLGV
jgi:hypothetical protein